MINPPSIQNELAKNCAIGFYIIRFFSFLAPIKHRNRLGSSLIQPVFEGFTAINIITYAWVKS